MDAAANVELLRFTDADALARAAAEAWLNEIEMARQAAKLHAVALSGGRITEKFFAEVVAQARANRAGFVHVHFFWADERCVPPEHAASNFRLAHERLLGPLDVPGRQIHRIRGELEPELAVAQAGAEMRAIVSRQAGGQPVLDLVLLGMGEDGHVASLFPDKPAAAGAHPAVFRAIRNAPKPPRCRVTLGYGALAAARQVWVLVSGAGKEAALRASLGPGGRTPLGRVIWSRSCTRVFSDIAPA
jgi:6-phosphogluconolactonase